MNEPAVDTIGSPINAAAQLESPDTLMHSAVGRDARACSRFRVRHSSARKDLPEGKGKAENIIA
jgi:hypothetical protein